MNYPSRSWEYSSAQSHVGYVGPFQAIKGNNVSMWVRENSCDNLAKNVVAVCPYHKNVPEPKLKSWD